VQNSKKSEVNRTARATQAEHLIRALAGVRSYLSSRGSLKYLQVSGVVETGVAGFSSEETCCTLAYISCKTVAEGYRVIARQYRCILFQLCMNAMVLSKTSAVTLPTH
jgi:hypothetical protein